MPTKQLVQADAAAAEYWPEEHVAVTAERPEVAQKLPAMHDAQVENNDAPVVPRKVPVGQLVQPVEAAIT